MLASIVQSLSTALGDVLEGFMTMFLEALNMNLSSFLDVFPLLSTFYTYLRSFAVAITAIVAGRALAMFWFGSIENSAKDNPLLILVKTFFAVAAIYWGGYVLEYIVHLGSIPYNHFLGIEAVTEGKVFFKEFITGFFGFASASIASWGNLAKGLCEIFLLIVIAWNLFKLVVEICERWLMVGVLVYTSPLIYCTIPSNDTSGVFRRWVSMFIGSVIQMSLSVMFLKLILSGFNGGNGNFVIKLLMILAMCKIAQRVDTYLQQLGVGVATTGGNMVGDLIAGAQGLRHITGSIGRGKGEKGASKGSILGSYAGRTNIGAGINAAAFAFRSGAGVRDAAKAGVKGAADNLVHKSPGGRAVSAAWAAQKANQNQKNNGSSDQSRQTNPRIPGQIRTPASDPGTGNARKTTGVQAESGITSAVKSPGSSSGKTNPRATARPVPVHSGAESTGNRDDFNLNSAGKAASPWNEAKKGFLAGTAYMLGRNQPSFTQDELRASEGRARANAAAVTDEALDYQSGGAVMPDDLRDDAKQIQEGKGSSRRMNYGENYKEYGIRNGDGNVLELNGDDDIRASIPASAAGVGINSEETPGGSFRQTLTDRCGGRAVSDYMAQAVSQDGMNSDGFRNYAVSMPAKQAYIENGLDEESYRMKGKTAAETARREDTQIISGYESSMPETRAARTAMESAKTGVEVLRKAGAQPEHLQAAENAYEQARQSLHDSTLAAGTKRVEEARGKLDSLERNGVSHKSKEYQEAYSQYEEQKASLNGYRQAYDRANTPGSYEKLQNSATADARANDVMKLSDSYDAIRQQATGLLDETIRVTDVFAKARALNNPHFIPADIPQTRMMAYDVFKDAIPDIKPGTGFSSVSVSDLPSNSDNPGNFENQGGREIAVTYTRLDGSTGTRTFLNGKGTSALPEGVASQFSVYKSADGRHWLTDDPQGMNRTAPASGRQVREPSLITNLFTSIKKRDRKR